MPCALTQRTGHLAGTGQIMRDQIHQLSSPAHQTNTDSAPPGGGSAQPATLLRTEHNHGYKRNGEPLYPWITGMKSHLVLKNKTLTEKSGAEVEITTKGTLMFEIWSCLRGTSGAKLRNGNSPPHEEYTSHFHRTHGMKKKRSYFVWPPRNAQG